MEPTPVRIVDDQPPHVRVAKYVGSGLGALAKSAVTGVVGAIVLAILAPTIVHFVDLVRPTCADPRGLVAVSDSSLHASGRAKSGPGQGGLYGAENAIDGTVSSIWVPPLVPVDQRTGRMPRGKHVAVVDPGKSTLELDLGRAEDIRLACVVNGLGSSYENYVNWSRVRTVEAWTDTAHQRQQSTLLSEDQGSFQNSQDVAIHHGAARRVYIHIVDTYEGQEIFSIDPDTCGTRNHTVQGIPLTGVTADPVGCDPSGTPIGGISEVTLYRQDPHAGWWQRWLQR